MDKKEFEHVCTFTGHRPERLTFSETRVIAWLEEEIKKAVDEGYTDFITGMQRGVDIWAAEIVLKLKNENKNLRHIAASPFKGVTGGWEASWKKRYFDIINQSDDVHYISDKPGRAAFLVRNRWLVDHSSRLIVVFCGAHGGTEHTINYAKNKGLEVIEYKK